MANVRGLSDEDLQMYAKEAASLIFQGFTADRIAGTFNWQVQDVNELLKGDVFQAHLRALDPDLADSFALSHTQWAVDSARAFARERLPEYMKQLDTLASSAHAENVRLNAILKLLDISKIEREDSQVQLFDLPPHQAKVIERALRAVLKEIND